MALPTMVTVKLKDCFGFVPSRTRDCLTRKQAVAHFLVSRLFRETSTHCMSGWDLDITRDQRLAVGQNHGSGHTQLAARRNSLHCFSPSVCSCARQAQTVALTWVKRDPALINKSELSDYPIFCPAASSVDFDLTALPTMVTVKLKDCFGFVPSTTRDCLARKRVVAQLSKGHFLVSRLLRERRTLQGQGDLDTTASLRITKGQYRETDNCANFRSSWDLLDTPASLQRTKDLPVVTSWKRSHPTGSQAQKLALL